MADKRFFFKVHRKYYYSFSCFGLLATKLTSLGDGDVRWGRFKKKQSSLIRVLFFGSEDEAEVSGYSVYCNLTPDKRLNQR